MASKLTSEQVAHVAKLSNLELSKSELGLFSKQLQEVIEYVEQLSEVDTKGVEPTYQTLDGATNVFRKDFILPSLSQEEALSGAERTRDGYFVTESVFDKKVKSQKSKVKSLDNKKREKIDKYNAILTNVNPRGLIGHKDLFMTKGIETTAGSRVLEGYVPQYSSTLVQRLEEAGFKTKFKMNQDAWAHGSSGENSDFGPTTNPWDEKRTPGGSSSGSAAAVASGLVEIATGTDTGGSIRLPAAFTNTTAIKPTYGALSRFGVIAMSSSLDCPSILARSVSKVRKYYRIASRADSCDATSQSQLRNKLSEKKVKIIGVAKEFFDKGLDDEVKRVVEEAIEQFENYGFKVIEVSLPMTKYGIGVYYLVQTTEVSSNLARYAGVRYGNTRDYFGAEAKRRIMLGTFASSAGYSSRYYEKAAKVRTLIIADYWKVFEKVDVLLAPISPALPFKLGEKTDNPLEMYLSDVLTVTVNLAGLPALALPAGFSKNGLPVGMQIIGPRWSEEMLFDLGEKYQKMTNFHTKKPKDILKTLPRSGVNN